ncbi:hypothetical protein [Desulfovibrio sp. JC010]|uniref:hypothetical protein n=1 Tax=Desulfovibrio sp. JC010 TaxID=2593641 RepID=UPI0013D7A77A|nr:hypothetical protein [Desulfovibrio sp. JC010]NDV28131.1 hypothetical protein [Desulfovibrio sp. JC010]
MKNYEYEFERTLVAEIVECYQAQGIAHTEFARMMYGDTKTAPSKWWKIREVSPTGKLQGMPVSEAVKAAVVLNIDVASLFFRVQEKMRSL